MAIMARSQSATAVAPKVFSGCVDVGNYDSKAFFYDDSKHALSSWIPSTILEMGSGHARLKDASSTTRNVSSDPYKAYITVIFRDKTYIVGYGAMIQSNLSTSQFGNQERYYSEEQLLRTLVAIALATRYQNSVVDLVTTAPFKYLTNRLKGLIYKTLQGTHQIIVNGTPYSITLNLKRVYVEGYPAFALISNPDPSNDQVRIMIDGGSNTFDLLTFYGNEPMSSKCRCFDRLGVNNIAEYVEEEVMQYHSRSLQKHEVQDILRAYGSQGTHNPIPCPKFAVGTSTIGSKELYTIVRQGAAILAKDVKEEAAHLWGVNGGLIAGDIGQQTMMGGAVGLSFNELKAYMGRLETLDQPNWGNAKGGAALALAMQQQ